jgi:hypothetical protein
VPILTERYYVFMLAFHAIIDLEADNSPGPPCQMKASQVKKIGIQSDASLFIWYCLLVVALLVELDDRVIESLYLFLLMLVHGHYLF